MVLGSWGLLLLLLKQEQRHWVMHKREAALGLCWRVSMCAYALHVISIPDPWGLHFNPISGDIWTQKNSFLFFSEQKITFWHVSCEFLVCEWSLGLLSCSNILFSSTLPFQPLSCSLPLGCHCQGEKGGSFWMFCLSPSSLIFSSSGK